MEKEKYEDLLKKLQKISDELNIVINNLELVKNEMINSIVIGDDILYKDDINDIYEKCYINKNTLNNIIIPTIKNKINKLNV